ncbi:MAG: hypothetical protein P8009_02690 [Gammaproteobacteria bacterium]|nr:hypothetical protein [Gammaproteobacteria bacterium]
MSQADLRVRVECYAGYRGEEGPRRFHIGERTVDVEAICDRWLGPTHRYFKVRGSDKGIYILRHDVQSGAWELTLFDSNSRPDTRLSST